MYESGRKYFREGTDPPELKEIFRALSKKHGRELRAVLDQKDGKTKRLQDDKQAETERANQANEVAHAWNDEYERVRWECVSAQLMEGARNHVVSLLEDGLGHEFVENERQRRGVKQPHLSLAALTQLALENWEHVDKGTEGLGAHFVPYFEHFSKKAQEISERRIAFVHPWQSLLNDQEYLKKSLDHLFCTEIFGGKERTLDLEILVQTLKSYAIKGLRDRERGATKLANKKQEDQEAKARRNRKRKLD